MTIQPTNLNYRTKAVFCLLHAIFPFSLPDLSSLYILTSPKLPVLCKTLTKAMDSSTVLCPRKVPGLCKTFFSQYFLSYHIHMHLFSFVFFFCFSLLIPRKVFFPLSLSPSLSFSTLLYLLSLLRLSTHQEEIYLIQYKELVCYVRNLFYPSLTVHVAFAVFQTGSFWLINVWKQHASIKCCHFT